MALTPQHNISSNERQHFGKALLTDILTELDALSPQTPELIHVKENIIMQLGEIEGADNIPDMNTA